MSYDFNAEDIFEMAERIEENGAAFYRKAADAVVDDSNKSFLLELALMEDDHKQVFSKMKNELQEEDKVGTVFDPLDEALSYLRSLADIRIFFEKKIDTLSMESILKTAITAEKDSIVFYVGMKELVPVSMGKSKIDKIINEEMKHISLLSKKLIRFEG